MDIGTSASRTTDAERVIYLDCHSTTPTDPAVLDAMLPCFTEVFGNPGSHAHSYGWRAAELVDQARLSSAQVLGVDEDELIFTSGSTESNNLAIFGIAKRLQGKRNHLVSIGIEHPSVLEPFRQLEREGWRVTIVPVFPQPRAGGTENSGQWPASTDASPGWPGVIDINHLRAVLSDQTALVSVALANHEIGVIQPLREIAELTHSVGALLHTDATQAVGWIPANPGDWHADLVSFSGHKFYGPKGVGALYVRRNETYPGARPVRLLPRMLGGGQEFGWRSGTLNSPGIVGFAAALRLAEQTLEQHVAQVAELRHVLWLALTDQIPDIELNGPDWLAGGPRLPHNLNFVVPGVEGQTIMLEARGVAVSSGSACSSSTPGVSSVLRAIGRSDDQARCSLRVGLGRFHSRRDVELAAERIIDAIRMIRK